MSPAGVTGVVEGGSQPITIAPDPGRAILDVVVDGASVGAVPAYTFSAVNADHTLQATFRDATVPTVTLTSPAGGERWDVGSVHAITWTAGDDVGVDSIDVDVSLAGVAGPWTAVAHGLANSGSTSWTVPAQPTDSARVRVTAYDAAMNAGVAIGDSAFHIVDPNVGVGGARTRFGDASFLAAGGRRRGARDPGPRRAPGVARSVLAGGREPYAAVDGKHLVRIAPGRRTLLRSPGDAVGHAHPAPRLAALSPRTAGACTANRA